MLDLSDREMEKDYDRIFPKDMSDAKFEELRKLITNRKYELEYLQHIHCRETGRNYNPL